MSIDHKLSSSFSFFVSGFCSIPILGNEGRRQRNSFWRWKRRLFLTPTFLSFLLQNKRKGKRKHKNLIKSLLIIALYSACENRLIIIMFVPNFGEAGERSRYGRNLNVNSLSAKSEVSECLWNKSSTARQTKMTKFQLYLQFPGDWHSLQGMHDQKRLQGDKTFSTRFRRRGETGFDWL